MYKIMIMEDDPLIREELSILLRNSGYETVTLSDPSVFIDDFKKCEPHLVLLDINLPVLDGFKLCSKIRTFSNVPIIFVTSRNTDMDELNSIMLGGDDFITKPFNTPILLARIASLLKRSYPAMNVETLTYSDIKLHLENGSVEYQGKFAELTKNELRILAFLFKNTGRIIPRADLVEYLWDNRLYVDDNALSVNITRLRDKLGQIGVTDLIKTKHRQGYMI